MATFRIQKKSSRGTRVCGAPGCQREIQTGEQYYWWKFRSSGRHVRCMEHPPRDYELTESKMSEVLQAISIARDELGTIEETKAAIAAVAEIAQGVVEEYREAAEAFGGQGPNGEKADELEGWVNDLEQFEPEEPEIPELDEDETGTKLSQSLFGIDVPDELDEEEKAQWEGFMQRARNEWAEEHGDAAEEIAEAAREEASELLDSCPQ